MFDRIKQSVNLPLFLINGNHEDSILKPYEKHLENKNILPCFQVVTMNPIPFSWDKEKDIFGISIDIVIFDYTKKRIDIIRLGDGEDRLCI